MKQAIPAGLAEIKEKNNFYF